MSMISRLLFLSLLACASCSLNVERDEIITTYRGEHSGVELTLKLVDDGSYIYEVGSEKISSEWRYDASFAYCNGVAVGLLQFKEFAFSNNYYSNRAGGDSPFDRSGGYRPVCIEKGPLGGLYIVWDEELYITLKEVEKS
ncbi:hypothetical protein [Parvularcula maris]|uniref:Lipoprotein n=1 Tax=Parvularcula maris TaxID=2965077 RepID=A0A9X2LBN9_9PROT|nr:hypothetical protein [Parvularcula maris]MCQ8186519.1 hypothetical protein [Parvularcula maris]